MYIYMYKHIRRDILCMQWQAQSITKSLDCSIVDQATSCFFSLQWSVSIYSSILYPRTLVLCWASFYFNWFMVTSPATIISSQVKFHHADRKHVPHGILRMRLGASRQRVKLHCVPLSIQMIKTAQVHEQSSTVHVYNIWTINILSTYTISYIYTYIFMYDEQS